jgi:hydroxypyruvate reductase/glycerate 2-kinase
VDAVDPFRLVRDTLRDPEPELRRALERAPQILVLGGGKAGAAMAAGVEEALADRLDRVRGVVNVPDDMVRPLRAIRLHPSRPAGTNEPTAAGVAGVEAMLELVAAAGPDDLALCPISGGGSALLPAPAEGITLGQKQEVTRLLHASGATIHEMNCVRKHLSRVKGGRLAQAFAGQDRILFSLILSDVVGDPLDVIASGPTAADPTTFNDALGVLERYGLPRRVPGPVLDHLRRGRDGRIPETPEVQPPGVHNRIVGNNALALAAARRKAKELGWPVLDLGAFIEGETGDVAAVHAGIVRSICADGQPAPPPLCLLSGGETTVTLGPDHGRGGRNQEFVLACLFHLARGGDWDSLHSVVVLSGGTDGEDGPTDAAGAIGDAAVIEGRGDAVETLCRHDTYPYLDAAGALLRTGLTGTNVMDVRVIFVS